MKLADLQDLVANASRFSRIGQFAARDGAIPFGQIASNAKWDWLPSSRDQPDPFRGDSIRQLSDDLGRTTERKEAELIATKTTLQSLRQIADHQPDLVDGPHDFTPAAKSAAQYAARMAAREIMVNRRGFWCDVIRLYNQGYWPCGLTKDGKLVVY